LKRLLLFLFFIPFISLAQVPQGVGYQGVATDANGVELVNDSISIRASVLSGSATGTIEWEETHATSTDTFGLFTLTIGQGTNTTNGLQTSFADISWGTNTHFLKIEMDVTGGTNYSFMGTNQMMSVPYALYAESANINYDSISNLLSNDSTFITNVGGGMGGSGCDIQYPDGLDGEPITYNLSSSYTVPAGKNLYITNLYSQSGFFSIDGVNVLHSYSNYNQSSKTAMPFIAKQGQILLHSSSAGSFNGFLVDALVDPITYNLSSSYTVPAGKNLYITNLYSQSGFFSIDGVNVLHSYSNYNLSSKTAMPFIAKQGQVLLHSSSAGSFNGYLVDENYFANCGGGGSSSQGPQGPPGPAGPSFFSNMQGGKVDVGSEPGLIKIVAVIFPTPFATPPNVICTASAQPGTIFDDSFNITVRSVTNTGFEMIVNRVDSDSWAQDLDAFWMAFE